MFVSVETPDDYTFKVNLAAYDASLIATLASSPSTGAYGYMISPTAWEQNGEEWCDTHPVGTGPFKFKEYQPENYVLSERFDDYWGGKPHLDGVKSILISDPVTAQLSFESGEAEAISFLGIAYILLRDLEPKGYLSDVWPELKTAIIPSSGNPDSPYANQDVRMAKEYAIDEVKICQSVYSSFYQPVYQFAPPALRPARSGFVPREYDPDKAKQLLANAGYENGFSTTLYCATVFNSDDVPLIQSYLNAAGICMLVFGDGYANVDAVVETINTITGWDMTMDELLKTGERIYTMRLAFNAREGLKVPFQFPDRLMGRPPKKVGPRAGIVLDSDEMFNEYLSLMGVDLKTGIPGKEKPLELGLDDVARVLWK